MNYEIATDVPISKESFQRINNVSLKLDVLFEAVVDSTQVIREHIRITETKFEKGNKRFKKLENGKRLDTAASFGGGIIGGIIAIVAKNLFGVGR